MKKKSLIFFLMGPTAIGKSSLAIALKKKFTQLEIISVDSKLVYKGLNIGTDKPSVELLKKFPHRLIDICQPFERYSVAKFYRDVHREIKNIILEHKVPLLVGGTMLYFKILLEGLSILPSSNFVIQKYIFEILCHSKRELLYQRLKNFDPIMSKKIHCHDVQRILRVLEVCYVTGKKFSDFLIAKKNIFPYTVVQLGLFPKNKLELFKKITIRFEKMLEKGLEKEVKDLFFLKNIDLSLPSLNSIGYKDMFLYLQKKITYQTMYNNILCSTRRLVKHQLTWLKNWRGLIHIEVECVKITENFLKKFFLKYFKILKI
ncbi:tRNA (adenosine(37)-N6)-dimethylallyltransferase MiaA [Buchnera aphidicola]|uniref:tRNA (adenosine(37)-N6)-dimethylallyltransferase MiaA n=1 Tax=Buchnera aphidicola TaxID=9 RepID=UPI0031B699BE